MALNRAPRRIIQLEKMATSDIDNLSIPSGSGDEPKAKASNWHIPLDYKNEGATDPEDAGYDYGTLRIPFSRVAMRDSNGLIPESMLPSYIDEIMFGTMSDTNASTTFTVVELGGTEKVFASPSQSGSQLVPPTNAIFYDTTNTVQYRWVESQKNVHSGEVLHGFTPIPNSKTITSTYGIDVNRTATETVINAKKPDFFTMYSSAGPSEVGNTFTKFPFDSGEGKSENVGLTAIASNDRVTVSGVTQGARYLVNLQLSAVPKTLSSNIIDVSFNCSTVPPQVQQMDMSGPAGAATKLNFVCSFRMNSGTTIDFQIKAEEAINVTTTRFTVIELL